MNRAVFRQGEIPVSEVKIFLDPPTSFPELSHLVQEEDELEDETEVEEIYTGPTVEDLRREADEFKYQWEAEKEDMISSSKAEAERIIKEAEDTAADELKAKTEEAESIKRQAEEEAESIIAKAHEEAKQIEADTRAACEAEKKEIEEQGRSAGREAGFAEGKAEVERLVERTQIVLERAQNKRAEILEETEQEIINLVLLITRKVVKAISESQRSVIVSNVVQALRKVKTKGTVIIRVNIADLKLATENTKNFISLLEGTASIQVQEDSSVDQGGCIIETDFGEIDARIASQLAELEAKILEISPIRSTPKSNAAPNGK